MTTTSRKISREHRAALAKCFNEDNWLGIRDIGECIDFPRRYMVLFTMPNHGRAFGYYWPSGILHIIPDNCNYQEDLWSR